jgi:hypothetical protein
MFKLRRTFEPTANLEKWQMQNLTLIMLKLNRTNEPDRLNLSPAAAERQSAEGGDRDNYKTANVKERQMHD